jgi:hypothetical protein
VTTPVTTAQRLHNSGHSTVVRVMFPGPRRRATIGERPLRVTASRDHPSPPATNPLRVPGAPSHRCITPVLRLSSNTRCRAHVWMSPAAGVADVHAAVVAWFRNGSGSQGSDERRPSRRTSLIDAHRSALRGNDRTRRSTSRSAAPSRQSVASPSKLLVSGSSPGSCWRARSLHRAAVERPRHEPAR